MSVIRLIITCITLCSQAGRLFLAEVLLQRFKSLLHRQALPNIPCQFFSALSTPAVASTCWSGVMLCRSQHSWRSSRSCASVNRRLHLDRDTGRCSRASVQRYRTQSSLPPSNITFQLQPSYTSMKKLEEVYCQSLLLPLKIVNEWRLASTSHGSLRYLPPGLPLWSTMFSMRWLRSSAFSYSITGRPAVTEGDVTVAVFKCHGGDQLKWSIFLEVWV